jgi:hypothetical protein
MIFTTKQQEDSKPDNYSQLWTVINKKDSLIKELRDKLEIAKEAERQAISIRKKILKNTIDYRTMYYSLKSGAPDTIKTRTLLEQQIAGSLYQLTLLSR